MSTLPSQCFHSSSFSHSHGRQGSNRNQYLMGTSHCLLCTDKLTVLSSYIQARYAHMMKESEENDGELASPGTLSDVGQLPNL